MNPWKSRRRRCKSRRPRRPACPATSAPATLRRPPRPSCPGAKSSRKALPAACPGGCCRPGRASARTAIPNRSARRPVAARRTRGDPPCRGSAGQKYPPSAARHPATRSTPPGRCPGTRLPGFFRRGRGWRVSPRRCVQAASSGTCRDTPQVATRPPEPTPWGQRGQGQRPASATLVRPSHGTQEKNRSLAPSHFGEPARKRIACCHRQQKPPIKRWCSREDSNFHGLPHTVLSRTRLPIPPRELGR